MSRHKGKGALLQSSSLRRGAYSWEETEITPLPAVIHKGGFELSRVLRNRRVAIYRQHQPGSDPDHAYEVILPQVRNTNHKGELAKPYEAFPSAESWGKKGWTFRTLDKAFQKLLQLRRRAINKASCRGTVSRKNRRGLAASHRPPSQRCATHASEQEFRTPCWTKESDAGERKARIPWYTGRPSPSTLPK
jgi:hypothetical protein